MIKHWIFLLLICLGSMVGKADTAHSDVSQDNDQRFFSFFSQMPDIAIKSWHLAFSKDSLTDWLAVLGSTAILYYYDEPLLLAVQKQGRQWGLGNHDKTTTKIKVGKLPIFRSPTDIGSSFYFLGDGWLHAAISSSFLITGNLTDQSKAIRTGTQILQGMIVSTIPNQLIKRTTGRESPHRRSQPRGKWRFFPSINDYNKSVSKYDAMPSGHIMTATLTLTIIDQNYPEYRLWVRPVGWTLISILGWQMLNNGVHWASDYPLGIAMGYMVGKSATQIPYVVEKSVSQISSNKNQATPRLSTISNWHFLPLISSNGWGLNISGQLNF